MTTRPERAPARTAERVPGDAQLLVQGGKLRAVAFELSLGGQDVGPGHLAGVEFALDEIEVLLVVADEVLHGRDLQARRGDGDRLGERSCR